MENRQKDKTEAYLKICNALFDLKLNPPRICERNNQENCLMMEKTINTNGYYTFQVNWYTHKIEPPIPILDKCSFCRIPTTLFNNRLFTNSKALDQLRETINMDWTYGFGILHPAYIDRIDNGTLPKYYIGKDVFYVDGEKELLIPVDGKTAPISYDRFEPIDDEDWDVREGCYDMKTRQVIPYPEKDEPWPESCIGILVYGPVEIDPIGYARRHGRPDLTDINFERPPRLYQSVTTKMQDDWGLEIAITEIMPEVKKQKKMGLG